MCLAAPRPAICRLLSVWRVTAQLLFLASHFRGPLLCACARISRRGHHDVSVAIPLSPLVFSPFPPIAPANWPFVSMYRTVFSRCARQSTPRVLRRGYAAAASASPFDWQDPLNAKNLLTEEELAISETAEKYCQEQLLPRVLRTNMLYFPLSCSWRFGIIADNGSSL